MLLGKKITMAKGAQKGFAYERKFCNMISLWWTKGEREDIFWRTAGSGGRARRRGRKNQQTKGQDGDICATDPIGQPLIDMFTIELKKGYNKHSLMDILDKPKRSVEQRYDEWIRKAIESRKQANSFSWMLVTHRDRREVLVTTPLSPLKMIFLAFDWDFTHVITTYKIKPGKSIKLVTFRLLDWLSIFTPEIIKTKAQELL